MDLSGDEVDHHHYQHQHHHQQQQQQHHQMAIPIIQETNPPLLLPPYNNNNNNNNSSSNNMKKMMTAVKYKECLKNHAASIGGNATDGCGEFMPSGEEGSLEALKCSACNCHRNFHRKEIEGMHDLSSSCTDQHLHCYHPHHYNNNNKPTRKGLLISQHQMIMPLGAIHTSDQSDHEMPMAARPAMAMKKRFRTKFSPLQKEKMLDFANQVGWKLQKQEDSFVQQFCQEIGVKRRVLKVWMHNNKHNFAKKINSTTSDHDPPSSSSSPPPPPPPLLNPPPPPPPLLE